MKTIGFVLFFQWKGTCAKTATLHRVICLGMNAVLCSWRSTQLVSAATWSKHLFMKVHRLACVFFTLDTPCWSYTLQWLGVVVEELCHGPRQLVFLLHVFSLACFVSAHPRQSMWSRLVCEERLQRVRVRWRYRIHCGEPQKGTAERWRCTLLRIHHRVITHRAVLRMFVLIKEYLLQEYVTEILF